ncbi:39S ribosomal protein L39, mitochondrial [Eumeta japonica]|uniref:39S ribosomal protein L39, mitochondrial n=1 Tax=Eumeta variegata TaxID=151549 RepID=A0A4C1WI33_EUMVA|nr:39S ribosomal protein L39, mitochondrial [Eumeta japonica]
MDLVDTAVVATAAHSGRRRCPPLNGYFNDYGFFGNVVLKKKEIMICEKTHDRFHKEKSDMYIPEQLFLWRKNNKKKQEVNLMENRITQMKQEFDHIMGKVSTKVCQHNTARRRCQDVQRRVWLLQNLSSELSKRLESLLTTRDIAQTLGPTIHHREVDIEKCLSLLSKNTHLNKSPDFISVTSGVNNSVESEIEDQLRLLVNNDGGQLWSELTRRRAALVDKLSMANANVAQRDAICDHGTSSKAVLTENYALYTLLSLDTLKNRIQIKNLHENLAGTISNFDNIMSSESRELLVLRCERVRADARVAALRVQYELLANAQGPFKMCYNGETSSPETVRRHIVKIHRDMEVKRDELNKLLCALSKIDIKIQNVKENLQIIFRGFQKDQPVLEYNLSQNIAPKLEDAEKNLDTIKKTLKENISKLQKVTKIIQHSQDNLKFWKENEFKKYISDKRTIDGNTYGVAHRTKLCRSELAVNDILQVLRSPIHLRRVPILRHRDAFVTNFIAAKLRLLSTQEAVERRNHLFNLEKKRQLEKIGRIEKIEVKYKGLPNNATLIMNKDISTPFDCAKHLSEWHMDTSALALLDDTLFWDMHRPLTQSCTLELQSFTTSEPRTVNKAFWRTCSLVLGACATVAFKDHIMVKLHSFPGPDNLPDLPSWQPTDQEMRTLSAEYVKLCRKSSPIERLEVYEDLALEMFKENEHKSKQIPNIARADGSSEDGLKQLYRFQGVALPTGIILNHFAYGILENRAKKLNPSWNPFNPFSTYEDTHLQHTATAQS